MHWSLVSIYSTWLRIFLERIYQKSEKRFVVQVHWMPIKLQSIKKFLTNFNTNNKGKTQPSKDLNSNDHLVKYFHPILKNVINKQRFTWAKLSRLIQFSENKFPSSCLALSAQRNFRNSVLEWMFALVMNDNLRKTMNNKFHHRSFQFSINKRF